MIKKGDKIKLVKPIGEFAKIGEICEVTDISNSDVITFHFGNNNIGIISQNEYSKYFEKFSVPVNIGWSEWELKPVGFYDINNKYTEIIFMHRNNGKKVQVRYKDCRAESTCCKHDEFFIVKGLRLATQRFIVKYLDRQVKELAENM